MRAIPTTDPTPLLDVRGVTLQYKTKDHLVTATYRVNFQVFKSDRYVLLGPSGCGKSTLLKAVGGYMAPTEGEIRLKDKVVTRPGPDRMMVFQEFDQLLPWKTVKENVMFPLCASGKLTGKAAEEKAMQYIEKVNLVKFCNHHPHMLSGGMKQRVVMVLSTLMDPSLLIADELTSALDVSTQKAVAEMLVEFRDRKFVKSTIVITHDLSILYQIADTILVVYAGKLVEKASAASITEDPRHPYTKLLLGSLPEVGVRFAEKRLTGIPGRPPSLLNPPTGCRFRARCPLAFDRCAEEPPFVEIEPGRFSSCWKTGT